MIKHGSSPRRQRGIALIIMLVLMTMGVLYLAVNGSDIIGAKLGRSQQTQAALVRAKEALIGYAATYRENDSDHAEDVFGYLPCPDMTAVPPDPPIQGNGATQGICGGIGQTAVGLLPYRTLGLEDLRDSDGVCLWYVVSGTFKYNPKSGPMNWDTQGAIQVRDANGNILLSPDDANANGGAAAVIIAAGRPLTGQNRTPNPANVCGALPLEVAAYLESPIIPAGTTVLTRGQVKDASGNQIGNDEILAVTPREIFDRIVVRSDFKNLATDAPPGWINRLSDQIRIAIETQLQSQLDVSSTPPIAPSNVAVPSNPGNYTLLPISTVKTIGDINTTIAFADPSDVNWFDNWRNQYRQVICNDVSTPCLSVSGTQCRGALLFAGRATSGGPRTSVSMASGTANLGAFFEPGQALEILNSASLNFAGQTTYGPPHHTPPSPARNPSLYSDPFNVNTDRALDAGICIFPGTFLSFNNGIGNFIAESSLSTNAPVAIDTMSRTITLGNTAASGSNSGCAWSPPIPFTASLRAYFTFRIADPPGLGEGFTFALADAAANSPSGILCGDGGNALGYSGTGIAPPKLGLEIDTHADTDPAGRNDPSGGHIAFVYWGSNATSADDNSHGTPSPAIVNGTQPLNPRRLPISLSIASATWNHDVAEVSTTQRHFLVPNQQVTIANASGYNGTYRITPINDFAFTYVLELDADPGTVSGGTVTSPFYGISTAVLPLNADIHVRIDITRRHNGTSGTYRLVAYVISNPDSCITLSRLRNLSFDMESLACNLGPTVSQHDIVIDDTSLGEAFANVYAGFTNGQSDDTAGEQNITISNFLLRSR